MIKKKYNLMLFIPDRGSRFLHFGLGAADLADASEERDRRQRHRRTSAQRPTRYPPPVRQQEN